LSGSNPLAVVMELNGSSARYGFDENDLHTRMLNYGFETMRYEGFQRELTSLNCQKNENGNTIYVRGMDYFVKRLKSAPQYQVFGLYI